MNGYVQHDNRLPAIVAAALLHLSLLIVLLAFPSQPPTLPIGSSVPINIVSSAPATDSRPAVQAPQTQEAQAPEPVPQAKPQPPAPVSAPPAFTQTAPQPTRPTQTPKPAPAQPSIHPAARPPAPTVDWSQMQRMIDHAQQAAGSQASRAPKGPTPRQETAPQARPDAGQGVSMSDQAGLQQLLERQWNPNCDAPGGASVKLQVKFVVGLSGHLLGPPDAHGLENSSDPVMAAAARRALAAVRRVEPYAEPFYGQTINATFDAKEACAQR